MRVWMGGDVRMIRNTLEVRWVKQMAFAPLEFFRVQPMVTVLSMDRQEWKIAHSFLCAFVGQLLQPLSICFVWTFHSRVQVQSDISSIDPYIHCCERPTTAMAKTAGKIRMLPVVHSHHAYVPLYFD
jgi:hypothetical protein